MQALALLDADRFGTDGVPAVPTLVARRLVAASADLDPASVEIAVCVPTFRRPDHLRLTLASLAAQETGRRVGIVVVENDAVAAAGAAVAAELIATGAIRGLCVVEPSPGNCRAINAAFGTARAAFPNARYFLMIDDDEVATPQWLERMVAAAEASGADIVGGPVLPRLAPGMSPRLARHPAFRPAHSRSRAVPIIYGSGNCLISRSVFERLAEPDFDLRFNFLGGGDTDFFVRCRALGMRFWWANEALIHETVPPVRTTTRWLLMRAIRTGAINHRIERKLARSAGDRLRLAGKTLVWLPAGLVLALARFAAGEPGALHPFLGAVGRLLAALGVDLEPYRAA
jgi:GT2 family glycosyltransferase